MRDAFEVLALEQAYFSDTMTLHYELLVCIGNRGTSHVCTDGGAIVGFLKSDIDEAAESASIDVLCTAVEYQRRGIARRLLTLSIAAIGEASRGRIKRIWLYVAPANTAAVALYKSAGFVIEARVPSVYSDGSPAYRMALQGSVLDGPTD